MKTPRTRTTSKIAFNVETKTLEKLVDDGEITESVLENYMRYAERTEVYKQASLLRRIIVGLRGMLLKRRVKQKLIRHHLLVLLITY